MMKHPDKSLELFEFNLGKVFDLFCRGDSPSGICGSCELCRLKNNVVRVREWFDRASDISQRRFLIGLIKRLRSIDLLRSVVRMLHPANSKDLVYVVSRSFPSLEMDRPTISDDRALDGDKLNKAIQETWIWFQSGSYWTKANFLLALFQICKLHLLHTVGLQSSALLQVYEKNEVDQDLGDDLEASSIASSHYTFSPENYPDVFSSLCSHEISCPSRDDCLAPSRTINVAGCSDNQADELSSRNVLQLLDANVSSEELSDFKDFIRYLPVHLSKYILRLLDQTSLSNCRHVSRLWQTLAQEVNHESRFRHNMKKDIELMQGASAEVCNPCYANDVAVAVPNVVCNGWDVMEAGSSRTCPEKDKPLFADAYAGFSTRKIIMEERNIYCGPYNVMKVTDRTDPSRVVDMDSERLIAVGGGDKRVHLINAESRQQLEPVISGHAGSVKCVLINEKLGFVISGSFDTSIRKWSLLTKKCLKIYRGHLETVVCLSLKGSLLASGSVDKTCKVWNIETGKCLKSFKHRTSVTSVAISDDLCISGSSDAQVKVWHLNSGSLIKKLIGHQKSITAIVFDRWHIVTSALDRYAFVWSSQGNFTKCLTALHHPQAVLCLVFKYLRVVTGCADGKIRIWNIVTGQCLRILRGNSHSDPISQLTAANNRILVNTKSCLLMMSFEPLEYDYGLCDDKMPSALQKPLRSLSRAQFQPRSYIRAQRMLLSGATDAKIIRHDELDSASPTTHSSSSMEAKSCHVEKPPDQISPKYASDIRDSPSSASIDCTLKEFAANGVEVAKTRGTVKISGHESLNQDETVDEGKRSRRRISWAFEHSVDSGLKHMSLAETSLLLKSQIRAKGQTRPPDFVARTVNVIQASMKPNEDDDNLEMNRRERELTMMKQSNRPLSSPSRVDPRSKVAVSQLELEKFRTVPLAETSNNIEATTATETKPSNNAIQYDRAKSGFEYMKQRSKSSLSVASPKVTLVRPHTSTVVRPSDLLDAMHLRPRSSLTRWRVNIRKNITTSSDGFAMVPMLMYPKELTSRKDELIQHRLVVNAKPRDSSPANDDGRWSKLSSETVSPYSDPLRSRIDLQLLTHQQFLDQVQKTKQLHEESEAIKRLEEERRKKVAWLQGIKSTSY